MNTTRIVAAVMLIAASGLTLHATQAQLAGTRRIDLQRHDLSIPGREVIQSRVEIDPGVTSSRHSHPGEEIVYVLEGSLAYQVEKTVGTDLDGAVERAGAPCRSPRSPGSSSR